MIHNITDEVLISLGSHGVLTVPAKKIIADLLERMNQPLPPAPQIGHEFEGGIYTGVARGKPDYRLITGPEIKAKNWGALVEAVAKCNAGGFTDWRLPTLAEQHLQMANIPEQFEKEWYASGKEHAGNPDCAWSTYFDYGSQTYFHKIGTCRARPVRSSEIQ